MTLFFARELVLPEPAAKRLGVQALLFGDKGYAESLLSKEFIKIVILNNPLACGILGGTKLLSSAQNTDHGSRTFQHCRGLRSCKGH